MNGRIYLAGPEVFLVDAQAVGERMKALCESFGYEGWFPLDNEIEAGEPLVMARQIQEANVAMIRRCDAVIANLSPFRGPEPDSGTVWEVGFAQGLGKRVLAYSSDLRPLKIRTQQMLGLREGERDLQGYGLEDFGLSHNLMLAPLVVSESLEGCLKQLG